MPVAGPDLSLQISPPNSYNQQQQPSSSPGALFVAPRSPHERVHGFDLWKLVPQRSGSCSDSDSNLSSSPAAAAASGRRRPHAGLLRMEVHQEVRIPLVYFVPLSPSPFLKLTQVK
ncbi:hypothetical protein BDL97_09G100300 [Sphagnum fallax]|nr:hypothetical protein BDL97_09G100300 [Sphagnum fallax]